MVVHGDIVLAPKPLVSGHRHKQTTVFVDVFADRFQGFLMRVYVLENVEHADDIIVLSAKDFRIRQCAIPCFDIGKIVADQFATSLVHLDCINLTELLKTSDIDTGSGANF